MTVAPARERLHDLMLATLADEAAHGDWTYRAVRPCPVPPTWHPGQQVWGDCSKGVQFLCRWAAAPDPMENDWADWGNSETMYYTLTAVSSPGELEVGDVVLIGVNGDDHAAMVLIAGPDPLLWSFGHEGAPNSYRLSADTRTPKYYRRLPVTDVVTPQDRLRAETGFFAWMSWYQGWNEWKHYGPRNKTVRPNVPLPMVLLWWARRKAFLARQKNGNP